MVEKKEYQKNWTFTGTSLAQLFAISEKEKRSQQNMIEVLIDDKFHKVFGEDSIAIADGYPIKNVKISRVPDVSS